MPEPPITNQRDQWRSEQQIWETEVGKHREDGPAWIILLGNGTVIRWVYYNVETIEVHPMTDMYPPQYWISGEGVQHNHAETT